MKKNCKACNVPLSDATKEVCPKCELLSLDFRKLSGEELKAITNGVAEIIQRQRLESLPAETEQVTKETVRLLRKSWRFNIQVSVIAFGALVFLYKVADFIWGTSVTAIVEKHEAIKDAAVSNMLRQALLETRSNIVELFKEPVIRSIVVNVASNEAKAILVAQLQPSIAAFQTQMLARITSVTDTTVDLTNAVREIKEVQEIQNLISAANNDDRRAYDELVLRGTNAAYKYVNDAFNAQQKVYDSYLLQPAPTYIKSVFYGTNAVPISQIKIDYKRMSARLRPAILYYVYSSSYFSRKEKLLFLLNVMETDTSLNAVAHAGRYFADNTQFNMMPLALDEFRKWWKEHGDEIK